MENKNYFTLGFVIGALIYAVVICPIILMWFWKFGIGDIFDLPNLSYANSLSLYLTYKFLTYNVVVEKNKS